MRLVESEISIPTRLLAILHSKGITTVEDFLKLSPEQLRAMNRVGRISLTELLKIQNEFLTNERANPKVNSSENVTQVFGLTSDELLRHLHRIEEKIDRLTSNFKILQEPKMYSVKELAKYCGVAELTVRNWISEGKIKAKTVSGSRRIFIEEEEFQKALSEVKSFKYQRK